MTNIHLLQFNSPVSDTQLYDMVENYRSINQSLKKLTKDETEIKKQLIDSYFHNNNEFIHQGRLLLTYDPRSRTGIDNEKLKTEFPEAHAACQTLIQYRQFSLK